MQGLHTTPVHGHAALFRVYGLLSLGLVLLVARRLAPAHVRQQFLFVSRAGAAGEDDVHRGVRRSVLSDLVSESP
jgi:hypothetical protein